MLGTSKENAGLDSSISKLNCLASQKTFRGVSAPRWVNTQINYANFQSMREMTASLKDILNRLNDPSMVHQGKYPFSK
ncbi:MAG: hypothetical protein JWP27_1282 [Flaviaesturariibacter sp.]|nr:hypothetical protein [Flaviaesturariibacter sp.]